MILPDVPPYLTAPRLITKAAQDIQVGLDANVSWLNRSYHIAKVGVIAETGLTYPQIYANDNTNNSYDLRPDNEMSAYSFIEIDRPYARDEEAGEITYFMSVVVWGNLALIDTTKDYDYTSQLIKDVSDALEGLGAEGISIEERPELIFNKYSGITQELKQFLMRKYTSFKLTFSYTTTYTDNCIPDPVDVCQLYIDKFEALSDSDQTCVQAQICESTPCEDATVRNSDSSYSEEVEAGGVLVLADITYRVYANGELISTTTNPAMSDYVINIED